MRCVRALGAVCDPNGHADVGRCPLGYLNCLKRMAQRVRLGRPVGDALMSYRAAETVLESKERLRRRLEWAPTFVGWSMEDYHGSTLGSWASLGVTWFGADLHNFRFILAK
jgi:hypothetical protein